MIDQDEITFLRRFMEARQKRDETKVAAAAAKDEYDELEAELFDKLDDGPVSRLNNIDLGEPWGKVSFGARSTTYGKVISGMQNELLEYFEERAMVDEMTAPTFAKKRLNEIARKVREEGEECPPGLDFYVNRGVTVTIQKGQ